ncbi:hypothetical protein D3C75_1178820 [compost metagenome]
MPLDQPDGPRIAGGFQNRFIFKRQLLQQKLQFTAYLWVVVNKYDFHRRFLLLCDAG